MTIGSRQALFVKTRDLWPAQLRIVGINEWGTAVLTQPPLSEVYDSVDDKLASGDDWGQVAAWAFHQALDKLGRRKFKQAEAILRPRDVSFSSFNTMMISNLAKDDWGDDWVTEREMWHTLS